MWILPQKGSNPRLLHWQADSSPLSHQGSPFLPFLCFTPALSDLSWPQTISSTNYITSPEAFYFCDSLVSRHYTDTVFLISKLHSLLFFRSSSPVLQQVFVGFRTCNWEVEQRDSPSFSHKPILFVVPAQLRCGGERRSKEAKRLSLFSWCHLHGHQCPLWDKCSYASWLSPSCKWGTFLGSSENPSTHTGESSMLSCSLKRMLYFPADHSWVLLSSCSDRHLSYKDCVLG